MKISLNQLRGLVRSELSSDFLETIRESDSIAEIPEESVLKLTENQPIDEHFEIVNDHNLLREAEQKIEEIKTINEEIRRMKQLVDFRSPLLGKDNL